MPSSAISRRVVWRRSTPAGVAVRPPRHDRRMGVRSPPVGPLRASASVELDICTVRSYRSLVASRDRTEREVDVLVIGGGVVGAAAALEAATQGRAGGAAGAGLRSGPRAAPAREAPGFTHRPPTPTRSTWRWACARVERWRELEGRIGERILFSTGVLSTGGSPSASCRFFGPRVSRPSSSSRRRPSGVRHPRRRATRPLLYQPDAGVIRADRALRGLLRLARDAGAELRARAGGGSPRGRRRAGGRPRRERHLARASGDRRRRAVERPAPRRRRHRRPAGSDQPDRGVLRARAPRRRRLRR